MVMRSNLLPTLLGRTHPGESTSGTLPRSKVLAAVGVSLRANGWDITETHEAFLLKIQLANRGPLRLAIFCTGSDRRLRVTDMKDVQAFVVGRGLHPVFVHGEELDPRVRGHVRSGHDILLAWNELEALDSAIVTLLPAMTGAIDCIGSRKTLMGWVKLSPTQERAHIIAWYEGKVVGECDANVYRHDLLAVGDANYAFRLELTEALDINTILGRVMVRAYCNSVEVGIVRFWNKMVINN